MKRVWSHRLTVHGDDCGGLGDVEKIGEYGPVSRVVLERRHPLVYQDANESMATPAASAPWDTMTAGQAFNHAPPDTSAQKPAPNLSAALFAAA